MFVCELFGGIGTNYKEIPDRFAIAMEKAKGDAWSCVLLELAQKCVQIRADKRPSAIEAFKKMAEIKKTFVCD